MPKIHFYIICFGFIFGSQLVGLLASIGIIEYPFYVRIEPDGTHFLFAFIQSLVFCGVIYFGNMRIIARDSYLIKTTSTTLWKTSKHENAIVVAFFLYALVITAYYWDEMLAESSLRHSGNHDLARLNLVITVLGFVFFQNSKYITRLIVSIILIYLGTIAGSIGSSRAAAIPFIAASFYFLKRRNLITGALTAYLGLIALSTAFSSRGDPSYFNYWNEFMIKMFNFDMTLGLLGVISQSFPGLSTIQASMLNPGSFSIESVLRFFIYLSPIPSSFLPDSIFSDLSLSDLLGIDRALLGINHDIYSEGIYWFGINAAWIYTLTAAILVLLPYFVAQRTVKSHIGKLLIFCLMVNVWMIYGGQVFTLRSGSRAVFALCILMTIYSIWHRIKLKR